jgi:hypothetical protein
MKDVEKENHKKFLDHLKKSHDAAWFIAEWIRWRKWDDVVVPKNTEARTHAEWGGHADEGDIIFPRGRLEVKERGFDFTGAHDWPYKDVIVCAKHSYDRADPKPYAFIYVNESWTHIGILLGNTRPKWGMRFGVEDSRYENYSQDVYTVSLGHMRWHKISPEFIEALYDSNPSGRPVRPAEEGHGYLHSREGSPAA